MDQLIINGFMIGQRGEKNAVEIWIKDQQIHAIGSQFDRTQFDQVIDAKHGLIAPGFIDVHVHLREPGYTYKETIKTGTKAAARGGFTTICAMPNVDPVPDSKDNFRNIQKIIAKDACVKVLPYASITKALRSEELVDMKTLAQEGAFAFTNDGVGVQTAGTMYQAMKEAKQANKAIVAHTEDESLLFGGVMHAGKRAVELGLPGILSVTESSQIARDLLLAEATGVHYHVCHVSTKESVRVIREAKQAGINVTCEVCPHHLLLIDEDIPADHGYYKMNPPLRASEDQQALIDGLLDGTIDCIATDHAPHGHDEKCQSFLKAPFGIVGSEYAFSLMYTYFVKKGIFTLEQVLNWMSRKPAELFDIAGGTLDIGTKADLVILDLETESKIDTTNFLSQATNTPFDQWMVFGETLYTLVDGTVVYQRGGNK
ncbi:dihydroorotase [Enterococcus bulliens]